MTRMAATRDGYGQALLDLADNPKVVVLEADLGKSTKSLHFRKAHPERTVSCGIGEQNMLLVGAGMAASGYIPFASTFAIFTERAFEQMRNGVARPNLAVHLCGSHGGTHTGTDGSSAQSIEDLAVFRTLPNVVVLHPCDDVSTRELTKQLASTTSPSYMRTARNKTPVMYDDAEDGTIVIGKGIELKGGLKAGKNFINNLKLFYHVANIGDVRSLAIHPASTTHSQLSNKDMLKAGVTPGYVRLSIGIEHSEDIINDIEQALEKI